MKEKVTTEELNAATMLILGIPAHQLLEVHVTSAIVSAIAVTEDDTVAAVRVPIATRVVAKDSGVAEEEPVDAELVEDDA